MAWSETRFQQLARPQRRTGVCRGSAMMGRVHAVVGLWLAFAAVCLAQPVGSGSDSSSGAASAGSGINAFDSNTSIPIINVTLVDAPYDIQFGDWEVFTALVNTTLNSTSVDNITITWSMGDGTVFSGNGLTSINYTYMEPGLYKLCVDGLDTVTSVASVETCTNATVRVPGDVGPVPEPVAIIGGPYGGQIFVPVVFNASRSYVINQDDRPVKYIWSFGAKPLPFLDTGANSGGSAAASAGTGTALGTQTAPATDIVTSFPQTDLFPTGAPTNTFVPGFSTLPFPTGTDLNTATGFNTATDTNNPFFTPPAATDTGLPPDALGTNTNALPPFGSDTATAAASDPFAPPASSTSFFNPFAPPTTTSNPFGTPATGSNIDPVTGLPVTGRREALHAERERVRRAVRRRRQVLNQDSTNTIDGLVVTDTPIARHTYTEQEFYIACLVVQVGEYRSSPNCTSVTIYEDVQAPVAVPGYNNNDTKQYDGIVGYPIEFNASASYDKTNRTLTYIWLFGDEDTAQPVNPLSPIVEHAYKFEGTYSACLVVNNGELSSAPTCVDVVVSNRTQFGEGPNLVRNPNFEQGHRYWNFMGNTPYIIIDQGCLNDTGRCLAASDNSGAYQLIMDINQTVTRAMRFQGWTKTRDTPELLLNQPYFRVMLTHYDGTQENVAVSPPFQPEDDTDCGTGWLLTSVDFTPKAPVMSAAVYLLQSTQFGRVYTVFDKISLQEL